MPTGGMAIWVKLKTGFPVARFAVNSPVKIIRWDEEENAFRFGFASIDEKELRQVVEALKKVFVEYYLSLV